MRKILILSLIFAAMLSGCGAEEPEQGFRFSYDGATIAMDQEAGPVLYKLGEPMSCSQTPSCAFEGMDTTYFHGSFYMTTYPVGSAEHISGLWFADDTVATQEGIRIGSTREEVEAAYGAAHLQGDACIIKKGNTLLTILLTGDTVSSVEYSLIFG